MEERLNVGWLLGMPLRTVDREITARLHERGFTDVKDIHGKVFENIRGDGSRLTDIAARAGMPKQTMQYLVDELERLGYVERIPDATDRRAKLVRATPRGRELVVLGRETIADIERRWTERLGERDMARLRTLLERLADEPEMTGPLP